MRICHECKHGELHGYPPEGAPEWYCFTVYMMCSRTGDHTSPEKSCDAYEEGEPVIVRDDADWGF